MSKRLFYLMDKGSAYKKSRNNLEKRAGIMTYKYIPLIPRPLLNDFVNKVRLTKVPFQNGIR